MERRALERIATDGTLQFTLICVRLNWSWLTASIRSEQGRSRRYAANCSRANSAYRPPSRSSASWLPSATIRP